MSEIAKKLGNPGRTDLAYRALIAVLHSIRDSLNLQKVFQLSAFFPLSIRGIYFEGYDPENVKVIIYNNQLLMSFRKRMGPCNGSYFEKYLDQHGNEKIKSEELIETIREKLKPENGVNPDLAFQAVMQVMYEKIPFENAKVYNLKNLMDLNGEFHIQG
ncbi:MAG: hypothetical protein WDZ29_05350 [Balneolaceae bacterium]